MQNHIRMCGLDIDVISENIARINPLVLELCCNKLQRLPLELGYMHSLTVLNVSKNKLKELPATIGLLTNLKELKASRNHLDTLPVSIKALIKLQKLKVSRNNIHFLPCEIGEMKKMVSLDISHNPLSTLPTELARLKYLRHIKCENVHFTKHLVDICGRESDFPSLKELAGRTIVARDISVWETIPQHIQEYLVSSHQCSFCQGPYFDSFISRIVVAQKNGIDLPFEHRLCSNHWTTEQEWIKLLFCSGRKHARVIASQDPTDSSASVPLSQLCRYPSVPNLDRKRFLLNSQVHRRKASWTSGV